MRTVSFVDRHGGKRLLMLLRNQLGVITDRVHLALDLLDVLEVLGHELRVCDHAHLQVVPRVRRLLHQSTRHVSWMTIDGPVSLAQTDAQAIYKPRTGTSLPYVGSRKHHGTQHRLTCVQPFRCHCYRYGYIYAIVAS